MHKMKGPNNLEDDGEQSDDDNEDAPGGGVCSGRGFVGEIHCDGRHGEDCDMTVLVVVTVVIMDEDEEDQQELDYG